MKKNFLTLLVFFLLVACSDNSDKDNFQNISEDLNTKLKSGEISTKSKNNSDTELEEILKKLSSYQLSKIKHSKICPSKHPKYGDTIYLPEEKRELWNECVVDTSSDNYEPGTLQLYENFGVHYVGEMIKGLPGGYGVLESLPDANKPCIYLLSHTVFGKPTYEVAQYLTKEDETSKQLNTCQSFKYYGKFDNRAKNIIVKTRSDLDKVHGFRNGSFLEGVLEITYLNGQKEKFEGTFFNESLRSEGILYYSNGDTFDGRFVRNAPFYGTYTTGSYIYKGQLDGNYPKGRGIITHQDGTIIDCSLECVFWPNKNSKQENNLNYKIVSNQEYIRLTKEDDESKYVISSYKSELPPCPKQRPYDNCFGEVEYTQIGTYLGEWKDNKRHGYGILKEDGSCKFNKMDRFLFKEVKNSKTLGTKTYHCKSLVYEGYWSGNYPHGYGEASITYSDGTKKRDEWVEENGVIKKIQLDEITEVEKFVGFWSLGSRYYGKHYFSNGDTFEGSYENDKEVRGTLSSTNNNGLEYINYFGEWDGQKRKGMGFEFSENGTIIFEGIWMDDGESKGKKYYENGDYYDGEFEYRFSTIEPFRSGWGELIENDGNKYYGEWDNDFPWGRGMIELNDGTLIDCSSDCAFWPTVNTKTINLVNYPKISNEEYLSRLDAESPPACGALENLLDLHKRQFSEGQVTLRRLNETKRALRNCIDTMTKP